MGDDKRFRLHVLFLFLVVDILRLVSAGHCPPCLQVDCQRLPGNCKYGIQLDHCGCCQICAQGNGERCLLVSHASGLSCKWIPEADMAVPVDVNTWLRRFLRAIYAVKDGGVQRVSQLDPDKYRNDERSIEKHLESDHVDGNVRTYPTCGLYDYLTTEGIGAVQTETQTEGGEDENKLETKDKENTDEVLHERVNDSDDRVDKSVVREEEKEVNKEDGVNNESKEIEEDERMDIEMTLNRNDIKEIVDETVVRQDEKDDKKLDEITIDKTDNESKESSVTNHKLTGTLGKNNNSDNTLKLDDILSSHGEIVDNNVPEDSAEDPGNLFRVRRSATPHPNHMTPDEMKALVRSVYETRGRSVGHEHASPQHDARQHASHVDHEGIKKESASNNTYLGRLKSTFVDEMLKNLAERLKEPSDRRQVFLTPPHSVESMDRNFDSNIFRGYRFDDHFDKTGKSPDTATIRQYEYIQAQKNAAYSEAIQKLALDSALSKMSFYDTMRRLAREPEREELRRDLVGLRSAPLDSQEEHRTSTRETPRDRPGPGLLDDPVLQHLMAKCYELAIPYAQKLANANVGRFQDNVNELALKAMANLLSHVGKKDKGNPTKAILRELHEMMEPKGREGVATRMGDAELDKKNRTTNAGGDARRNARDEVPTLFTVPPVNKEHNDMMLKLKEQVHASNVRLKVPLYLAPEKKHTNVAVRQASSADSEELQTYDNSTKHSESSTGKNNAVHSRNAGNRDDKERNATSHDPTVDSRVGSNDSTNTNKNNQRRSSSYEPEKGVDNVRLVNGSQSNSTNRDEIATKKSDTEKTTVDKTENNRSKEEVVSDDFAQRMLYDNERQEESSGVRRGEKSFEMLVKGIVPQTVESRFLQFITEDMDNITEDAVKIGLGVNAATSDNTATELNAANNTDQSAKDERSGKDNGAETIGLRSLGEPLGFLTEYDTDKRPMHRVRVDNFLDMRLKKLGSKHKVEKEATAPTVDVTGLASSNDEITDTKVTNVETNETTTSPIRQPTLNESSGVATRFGPEAMSSIKNLLALGADIGTDLIGQGFVEKNEIINKYMLNKSPKHTEISTTVPVTTSNESVTAGSVKPGANEPAADSVRGGEDDFIDAEIDKFLMQPIEYVNVTDDDDEDNNDHVESRLHSMPVGSGEDEISLRSFPILDDEPAALGQAVDSVQTSGGGVVNRTLPMAISDAGFTGTKSKILDTASNAVGSGGMNLMQEGVVGATGEMVNPVALISQGMNGESNVGNGIHNTVMPGGKSEPAKKRGKSRILTGDDPEDEESIPLLLNGDLTSADSRGIANIMMEEAREDSYNRNVLRFPRMTSIIQETTTGDESNNRDVLGFSSMMSKIQDAVRDTAGNAVSSAGSTIVASRRMNLMQEGVVGATGGIVNPVALIPQGMNEMSNTTIRNTIRNTVVPGDKPEPAKKTIKSGILTGDDPEDEETIALYDDSTPNGASADSRDIANRMMKETTTGEESNNRNVSGFSRMKKIQDSNIHSPKPSSKSKIQKVATDTAVNAVGSAMGTIMRSRGVNLVQGGVVGATGRMANPVALIPDDPTPADSGSIATELLKESSPNVKSNTNNQDATTRDVSRFFIPKLQVAACKIVNKLITSGGGGMNLVQATLGMVNPAAMISHGYNDASSVGNSIYNATVMIVDSVRPAGKPKPAEKKPGHSGMIAGDDTDNGASTDDASATTELAVEDQQTNKSKPAKRLAKKMRVAPNKRVGKRKRSASTAGIGLRLLDTEEDGAQLVAAKKTRDMRIELPSFQFFKNAAGQAALHLIPVVNMVSENVNKVSENINLHAERVADLMNEAVGHGTDVVQVIATKVLPTVNQRIGSGADATSDLVNNVFVPVVGNIIDEKNVIVTNVVNSVMPSANDFVATQVDYTRNQIRPLLAHTVNVTVTAGTDLVKVASNVGTGAMAEVSMMGVNGVDKFMNTVVDFTRVRNITKVSKNAKSGMIMSDDDDDTPDNLLDIQEVNITPDDNTIGDVEARSFATDSIKSDETQGNLLNIQEGDTRNDTIGDVETGSFATDSIKSDETPGNLPDIQEDDTRNDTIGNVEARSFATDSIKSDETPGYLPDIQEDDTRNDTIGNVEARSFATDSIKRVRATMARGASHMDTRLRSVMLMGGIANTMRRVMNLSSRNRTIRNYTSPKLSEPMEKNASSSYVNSLLTDKRIGISSQIGDSRKDDTMNAEQPSEKSERNNSETIDNKVKSERDDSENGMKTSSSEKSRNVDELLNRNATENETSRGLESSKNTVKRSTNNGNASIDHDAAENKTNVDKETDASDVIVSDTNRIAVRIADDLSPAEWRVTKRRHGTSPEPKKNLYLWRRVQTRVAIAPRAMPLDAVGVSTPLDAISGGSRKNDSQLAKENRASGNKSDNLIADGLDAGLMLLNRYVKRLSAEVNANPSTKWIENSVKDGSGEEKQRKGTSGVKADRRVAVVKGRKNGDTVKHREMIEMTGDRPNDGKGSEQAGLPGEIEDGKFDYPSNTQKNNDDDGIRPGNIYEEFRDDDGGEEASVYVRLFSGDDASPSKAIRNCDEKTSGSDCEAFSRRRLLSIAVEDDSDDERDSSERAEVIGSEMKVFDDDHIREDVDKNYHIPLKEDKKFDKVKNMLMNSTGQQRTVFKQKQFFDQFGEKTNYEGRKVISLAGNRAKNAITTRRIRRFGDAQETENYKEKTRNKARNTYKFNHHDVASSVEQKAFAAYFLSDSSIDINSDEPTGYDGDDDYRQDRETPSDDTYDSRIQSLINEEFENSLSGMYMMSLMDAEDVEPDAAQQIRSSRLRPRHRGSMATTIRHKRSSTGKETSIRKVDGNIETNDYSSRYQPTDYDASVSEIRDKSKVKRFEKEVTKAYKNSNAQTFLENSVDTSLTVKLTNQVEVPEAKRDGIKHSRSSYQKYNERNDGISSSDRRKKVVHEHEYRDDLEISSRKKFEYLMDNENSKKDKEMLNDVREQESTKKALKENTSDLDVKHLDFEEVDENNIAADIITVAVKQRHGTSGERTRDRRMIEGTSKQGHVNPDADYFEDYYDADKLYDDYVEQKIQRKMAEKQMNSSPASNRNDYEKSVSQRDMPVEEFNALEEIRLALRRDGSVSSTKTDQEPVGLPWNNGLQVEGGADKLEIDDGMKRDERDRHIEKLDSNIFTGGLESSVGSDSERERTKRDVKEGRTRDKRDDEIDFGGMQERMSAATSKEAKPSKSEEGSDERKAFPYDRRSRSLNRNLPLSPPVTRLSINRPVRSTLGKRFSQRKTDTIDEDIPGEFESNDLAERRSSTTVRKWDRKLDRQDTFDSRNSEKLLSMTQRPFISEFAEEMLNRNTTEGSEGVDNADRRKRESRNMMNGMNIVVDSLMGYKGGCAKTERLVNGKVICVTYGLRDKDSAEAKQSYVIETRNIVKQANNMELAKATEYSSTVEPPKDTKLVEVTEFHNNFEQAVDKEPTDYTKVGKRTQTFTNAEASTHEEAWTAKLIANESITDMIPGSKVTVELQNAAHKLIVDRLRKREVVEAEAESRETEEEMLEQNPHYGINSIVTIKDIKRKLYRRWRNDQSQYGRSIDENRIGEEIRYTSLPKRDSQRARRTVRDVHSTNSTDSGTKDVDGERDDEPLILNCSSANVNNSRLNGTSGDKSISVATKLRPQRRHMQARVKGYITKRARKLKMRHYVSLVSNRDMAPKQPATNGYVIKQPRKGEIGDKMLSESEEMGQRRSIHPEMKGYTTTRLRKTKKPNKVKRSVKLENDNNDTATKYRWILTVLPVATKNRTYYRAKPTYITTERDDREAGERADGDLQTVGFRSSGTADREWTNGRDEGSDYVGERYGGKPVRHVRMGVDRAQRTVGLDVLPRSFKRHSILHTDDDYASANDNLYEYVDYDSDGNRHHHVPAIRLRDEETRPDVAYYREIIDNRHGHDSHEYIANGYRNKREAREDVAGYSGNTSRLPKITEIATRRQLNTGQSKALTHTQLRWYPKPTVPRRRRSSSGDDVISPVAKNVSHRDWVNLDHEDDKSNGEPVVKTRAKRLTGVTQRDWTVWPGGVNDYDQDDDEQAPVEIGRFKTDGNGKITNIAGYKKHPSHGVDGVERTVGLETLTRKTRRGGGETKKTVTESESKDAGRSIVGNRRKLVAYYGRRNSRTRDRTAKRKKNVAS